MKRLLRKAFMLVRKSNDTRAIVKIINIVRDKRINPLKCTNSPIKM
jgi:hypothetical protein